MDELARRYLLVALGAGRLFDGIVDAYYGPAELRAEAEARAAAPADLVDDALGLRDDVAATERDGQRREWLIKQLVALETILRRLGGEELDYLDEVERCFDARPALTPETTYEEAFATVERALPGSGELRQRVEQHNQRMTVPVDRLPAIVDWLIGEIRADSARHFPAPAGESLTVSLVTDQPWSAYNWYDGDLRSRIEINTDLPVRAHSLIALLTHECFPGHHLEHAWKEQRLARELGRGEASVQLINTPEAYISEGLGEVGGSLIIDRQRWTELLGGICQRAGIELAAGQLDEQWPVAEALDELRAVGGDASLMLHHRRRPADEVIDFIERRSLRSREQAAKTLEFINHPLWRSYVFCYAGGERLLRRWLDSAGDDDARRARFARLLTEQLTPSAIAAETASSPVPQEPAAAD